MARIHSEVSSMKRTFLQIVIAALMVMPVAASAKLKVVTSLPGLASLVREVGGDRVEVESLAAPNQDPHFVDGRPSFISKLNRADLLVYTGLELEAGWLPPVVTNARNGKIQPGQPGNLDASRFVVPLLGVPSGQVDRRMGDVHPGGNPHFLLSPKYGLMVAHAIAERMTELDPPNAAAYRAGDERFRKDLEARMAGWEASLSKYRGQPIVGYHESTIYLTEWLGLKPAGYLEAIPGITPSPSHLAQLILTMKSQGMKVIIAEPWYDLKTAQVVASKAGASVAVLPGDAGGSGTQTYADMVAAEVRALLSAFEGKAEN